MQVLALLTGLSGDSTQLSLRCLLVQAFLPFLVYFLVSLPCSCTADIVFKHN